MICIDQRCVVSSPSKVQELFARAERQSLNHPRARRLNPSFAIALHRDIAIPHPLLTTTMIAIRVYELLRTLRTLAMLAQKARMLRQPYFFSAAQTWLSKFLEYREQFFR
jgi:hypothetical protein